MRPLTLLLLLPLLTAGCAWLPDQVDETTGMNASELYSLAKEALGEHNYEMAIDYYVKLEGRYPYGRYAEQAQLETAYAHYKAQEPAAAVAAADRFIKLHPRHPHVAYAYYLRGLAMFEPGDNFLERFVPTDKTGRDPAAAREAFGYFQELITRFPDSRYTKDAVQRMTYLRNRLADYEVRVAAFYLTRGADVAAAERAGYVVENYDRTPAVPEALALMVEAYRRMEMGALADDALRVLRLNYPDHPALKRVAG